MSIEFKEVKPKKLTAHEKHVEESRRAYHHFLETVAKDRLYLLAIVTGGKAHWKSIAAKAFSGFLIDDTLIDQMYDLLAEHAGPDPVQQYEQLQQAELVALKLDRLQGLANMIEDERHLDEVLDRWSGKGFQADERAALRTQLLLLMKARDMKH